MLVCSTDLLTALSHRAQAVIIDQDTNPANSEIHQTQVCLPIRCSLHDFGTLCDAKIVL